MINYIKDFSYILITKEIIEFGSGVKVVNDWICINFIEVLFINNEMLIF